MGCASGVTKGPEKFEAYLLREVLLKHLHDFLKEDTEDRIIKMAERLDKGTEWNVQCLTRIKIRTVLEDPWSLYAGSSADGSQQIPDSWNAKVATYKEFWATDHPIERKELKRNMLDATRTLQNLMSKM